MMDALPNFNVVDVVAIILIVIVSVRGYRRGLSGELASVIGVVASFVLGLYLYRPIGEWTSANTRLSEQAAHALAFGITVVLVILASVVLRALCRKAVTVVFAESIDKCLGFVAGFARSCVIVTIVFLVMNLWPHPFLNRHFGEGSIIGGLVLQAIPSIRETIREVNIRPPRHPTRNEQQ